MKQSNSQVSDAQFSAGAGGEHLAGSPPLPYVSGRWVAAGWAVAGLSGAAASLFTVMSLHTSNAGMSSGPTSADFTVYSTETSFDAWGRTVDVSSVTSGSPTPSGGMDASTLTFRGGPIYGIVLCAAAVMLLVAAISTVFPGRFGLPRLLRGLGPVGAGVLVGVAACQALAFSASSQPFTRGGVFLPLPGPPDSYQLGPCPWITLAAALLAVTTWLVGQHHSSTRRSVLGDAQLQSIGPGRPEAPTEPAPLVAPQTPGRTPGGGGSAEPEPRLEQQLPQDPQLTGDSGRIFRRPPNDIGDS